ncbi:MAG: hypothetical protein AB1782_16050 [Cyanobacteriota bacterium]
MKKVFLILISTMLLVCIASSADVLAKGKKPQSSIKVSESAGVTMVKKENNEATKEVLDEIKKNTELQTEKNALYNDKTDEAAK